MKSRRDIRMSVAVPVPGEILSLAIPYFPRTPKRSVTGQNLIIHYCRAFS
jgi:hypothetical protein